MTSFPVHTIETAPEASKALLQQTQNKFGFIPNLIGIMASSPAITQAYLSVDEIFSKSSLSSTEQQTVLLTVSHYHQCQYCMAAHTAISGMLKVKPDVVQALRDGKPINDTKLEALRQFTWQIIDNRGWVAPDDVQPFLDAGYESSHMLDILVGVAQKTLSNFTNHLTGTPLDDAFAEVAWKPEEKA
ncbi:Macrophage infectivity potentiator-related protein [hydrothermal vent metagenome]|uniref:Macrophage infectivity potentiator-related protein n=1 Tax=hydrothermal vent metagenome TaxID=652676 RepID=A0A3B0XDV7_9ZZZZ